MLGAYSPVACSARVAPPFFVRIVTRGKKGKNDPENDAMSHEPWHFFLRGDY